MPRCDSCGTFIVAGGVRDGDRRYCRASCQKADHLNLLVKHLPDDIIDQRTLEVHEGPCPRCGGNGPIDLHTGHYIWSALLFAKHHIKAEICCGWCGFKRKAGAIGFCLGLGWWSHHGLLFTPVVIFKNLMYIAFEPRGHGPSRALRKVVAKQLAGELWARAQVEAELERGENP